MNGVATDPWTAAQVSKRADLTGPQIIEEWVTYGPFVDARASGMGLALGRLLFDAVNHEHDLRFALQVPGARDSDALWVGIHFVSANINPRLAGHGLAPLAVVVDGGYLTPVADVELHGNVFDIVRSACARRSVNQIRGMRWKGDASKHYDKLFPFTPPEEDIPE